MRLRSALEAESVSAEMLAFVEAVVVQRTYGLGETDVAESRAEDMAAESERESGGSGVISSADRSSRGNFRAVEHRIADRVIRLVDGLVDDESEGERRARELADDPVLLAAFFQNLDLLPADGGNSVDAIALLVAGALHHLTETNPGP